MTSTTPAPAAQGPTTVTILGEQAQLPVPVAKRDLAAKSAFEVAQAIHDVAAANPPPRRGLLYRIIGRPALAGISFVLPKAWPRADAALSSALVAATEGLRPAETGSVEERALAAAFVAQARGAMGKRVLTAQADTRLEQFSALAKDGSPKLRAACEVLLRQVFDGSAQPRKAIANPHVVLMALTRMEQADRARFAAIFKPLLDAHQLLEADDKKRASFDWGQLSKWRQQSLVHTLAGRVFRYRDQVSDAEDGASSTGQGGRALRFEAGRQNLDDRLQKLAKEGQAELWAKTLLPPPATEEDALRLAAHYEELGYQPDVHATNGGFHVAVFEPESMTKFWELV